MALREAERDLRAQAVADDDGAGMAFAVEQRGEVVGPDLERDAPAGARWAVAAQVRADQRALAAQRAVLDKLGPTRVIAGQPVQQQQRRGPTGGGHDVVGQGRPVAAAQRARKLEGGGAEHLRGIVQRAALPAGERPATRCGLRGRVARAC